MAGSTKGAVMPGYSYIPDTPDFLRWYEHYPRKQARGDAKKAWLQTAPIRPPVEQMIKSLIVQRAQPQWRESDGAFVPLPATYLRREQWSDAQQIEVDRVRDGKAWHETVKGIERRAAELGMTWDTRNETFQQFMEKVVQASGAQNVVAIRR